MKFKIKYCSRKFCKEHLAGKEGMNSQAARKYFKIPYKEGLVFYICSERSKEDQRKIIDHEEIEYYLMRYKKMAYKKAHKITMKFWDSKLSAKKIIDQLKKKY